MSPLLFMGFFVVVALITLESLWVNCIIEVCALYICDCFWESESQECMNVSNVILSYFAYCCHLCFMYVE